MPVEWQTPDAYELERKDMEASGVTVYTTGELLDAMRDAGGEAG